MPVDDHARRAIMRDALGIGVATGAYGVSFGALSTAAGLSLLQTSALSLLMFTGASQFAMVALIGGGGSPIAGAATAVLLGTRNAFYGLRLSAVIGRRARPAPEATDGARPAREATDGARPALLGGRGRARPAPLRGRGRARSRLWAPPAMGAAASGRAGQVRRAAAAQFIIDETTAMALATDADADADADGPELAFWATAASVFTLWNLGTLVGALGAQAIPNPKTLGLDAAAPAAFIALVAPRMKGRSTSTVAAAAAAAAMVAVPFVPAGVPILLAALVTVAIGFALEGRAGPAPEGADGERP